jgi:lipoate-protein ligase A
MAGWLLIDDGPAGGARNMAVDEFLLKRAEIKGGAPVLRLYSFHPPAITIGYHQDAREAVDLEAAAADGLDVVRRITGGRALLHDGELTYSVVSPADGLFGKGLGGAFVSIAGVIVDALRSAGVEAELGSSRRVGSENKAVSPCLVSASMYEITAGGRKIAGSAQRRSAGGFIQHGSILMRSGSERIERYLSGGWEGLAGVMTTVEQQTGEPDMDGKLRELLIDEFCGFFGTCPERLTLGNEDIARIEKAAGIKKAEFATGRAEA